MQELFLRGFGDRMTEEIEEIEESGAEGLLLEEI
jgi:hypothetical protein